MSAKKKPEADKAEKSEYDALLETLEAETNSPNSSVADNAKRLLIIAKGR